jgi:hypothetical protein
MELNDDDGLSASERRLVSLLSELADDPSPQSQAAIMAAVSKATRGRPIGIARWRPAIAGLAAAAAIVGSTVGVAASGEALPNSPAYPVRVAVERVWLTVSGPTDREHLRLTFANARISQAKSQLSQGDRANAESLLRDSRSYLNDAKNDLGGVPANEQGQIQNQLNQTQADEQQSETQLNQEGNQGGNQGG